MQGDHEHFGRPADTGREDEQDREGEDEQDRWLSSGDEGTTGNTANGANVALRNLNYRRALRLNSWRFARTKDFRGGIVQIVCCRGRREVVRRAIPDPPTGADFGAAFSFIFKTSSLKPAQKFPAPAYSDTEKLAPHCFSGRFKL